AFEAEGLAVKAGDGADGGAARAVERPEQRSLRQHGCRGRRVVERRNQVGGALVGLADFEADGTLCRGRREPIGIEIGCYLGLPPSRLSPATANSVASATPSASLRRRVSTLPRNGTI